MPWLAGYVVRRSDISSAPVPRSLHADLGLGFPGSPFREESETIDVLRLPPSATLQLASPGTDDEASGPAFRDHSPLGGTGFVESAGGFVPYWWMAPSPIPAGSTLWRVHADGREEMLAAYAHVAAGWLPGKADLQVRPAPVRNPQVLGLWAEHQGERLLADVLPDGTAILCSPDERPDWAQSPRGLWWREAARSDVDRIFVVRLLATWRGREFQVVAFEAQGQEQSAHLVYVGHDALDAESLELTKTDAGVYEAVVPAAELENLREAQADLPA